MMTRIMLLFLLMGVYGHAMALKLESLVVKQHAGKSSVFYTITGKSTHKVFALSNPNRIVMDFDQTSTTVNAQQVVLGNGIISHIRSGHPTPHILRFVFDVKQAVMIRPIPCPFVSGFCVDLVARHTTVNEPPVKASAMPPQSVQVSAATKSVPVKHAPSRSLRDVIVVIDPGHGGKDPGAMGPRHNVEKNVVLAISLKLKQMIDRQPGMHAVLTRNGDYYVGLRERLSIARKYNADVFIAIHADAFNNQHSNGASVFALSQTGATSEAARWLAEKENYSELGGVNLSGLDDQSGLIRTVLLDLSQTATIGAGLQMGSHILQYLGRMTTLHNVKTEQARFVVLKSPDIPSVLVETGFISNPREESNLTSSAYQTRLSKAIFEGVKLYFWDHPIQGTRLEAMSGANTHLLHASNN